MINKMGQLSTVIEKDDQHARSKYPPLDLYILIPCVTENDRVRSIVGNESEGISNKFLKSIAEVAKYEMDNGLASQLERKFLCQVTIVCLTDDVDHDEKIELGRQKVNLYLTVHMETGLACVTLVFPDTPLSVTHLLDQMSRDEILIEEQNETINLLDWISTKYGLRRMGLSRSFTNLSSRVDVEDLMYLLANEVNGSRMIEYKLIGRSLKEAAENNIAQFDLSEVYVNECSVVQIYKDYKKLYEDRIYDQALTLFIMEIILLQDVAVSRVNERVSNELNRKSDISLKVIEELNLNFAKTMFLWNLNHFKYSATRAVVSSFVNGLKIHEQIEIYRTNKEFLEDLINVYTARRTNRMSFFLNIVILFLTLSQVLPIYYDISKKVVEGSVTPFDIGFGMISLFIVCSLLFFSRVFLLQKKE